MLCNRYVHINTAFFIQTIQQDYLSPGHEHLPHMQQLKYTLQTQHQSLLPQQCTENPNLRISSSLLYVTYRVKVELWQLIEIQSLWVALNYSIIHSEREKVCELKY